MVSHPNRSKKTPKEGRNPSPEEIIQARNMAGLTQEEAAAVVYKSTIAWKKWEGGNRRMPPDTWELLLIKLGFVRTPQGEIVVATNKNEPGRVKHLE